jgi:hypothetical protein
MLSKNQDLDFQRSITFLIPKRKELFVLFLFPFKGTHESSISLRSNSFSFYGIFKLLTLACKSYVGFRCCFYKLFLVYRASTNGKRTTVTGAYIFFISNTFLLDQPFDIAQDAFKKSRLRFLVVNYFFNT